MEYFDYKFHVDNLCSKVFSVGKYYRNPGAQAHHPSAGACPPPSAAETTASNMSKLVARIPAMAKGKDSFRVRVESTTSVLCERLLFGFMKLSNQMIYSVSPVHLVDGIVIGIF